jgi:hypothetical protein
VAQVLARGQEGVKESMVEGLAVDLMGPAEGLVHLMPVLED